MYQTTFLILETILWADNYYYPHFAGVETEAHTG